MEIPKDSKSVTVAIVFAIFAALTLLYPSFAGLLLITALLTFGSFSLFWKESRVKILSMILLVLLALTNIAFNGLKFGIDFSGGTRIPIILERSVDQPTMSELINTIKTRVSVLGLTEIKVRAVGDNEINVEMPTSNENTIRFIEETLSKQGVYQGIVDGKLAVSGEHIYSTSIRSLGISELQRTGADWGVGFSVDKEGGDMFANAARNKNDYPVYMFLDRPKDAVLFYTNSSLKSFLFQDASERETLRALNRALAFNEGNISVYLLDGNLSGISPKTNQTKAIVSSEVSESQLSLLRSKGFQIVSMNDSKMIPVFTRSRGGELLVTHLEAVGLLSGPLLGPEVTSGIASYGYVITGSVANVADPTLRSKAASDEVKSIQSILKGGALPVKISVGSRTVLPASLGEEFLRLSLIAIAASLAIISLLIGIRYRTLKASIPILLISLGELVILISILGSFTIDLAAVAGILAAIGVGVDAQIVITDELTKRDEDDEHHDAHEKVNLAFGIIRTNAIVAIFSMLPLLFSGLVEVIGFAISTILGALLGYLLTRPTYAAIIEETLGKEKEAKKS
ncbi:hypothetical protein HY990_03175 [Candidatus Micrarchaeota archaeon]|nr:hypothetical protein [Candidatus Micrarchaeota archaeon]